MPIIPDKTVHERYFSKRLLALKPKRREIVLKMLDRKSMVMEKEASLLAAQLEEVLLLSRGGRLPSAEAKKRLLVFETRAASLRLKFLRFTNLGQMHFNEFDLNNTGKSWSDNPIEARAHNIMRNTWAIGVYLDGIKEDLKEEH